MNREDIIRMATIAGVYSGANEMVFAASLERFAALAAEWGAKQEREACAKVVEDKFDFCGDELTAADAIRKLKNENSALKDSLYSRDKSLTYAQIQLHAAHWTMTFLSMCLVVMTLAAIAAVIWAVRMSP